MTVDDFKEMMGYNEPSFGYNGQEYSICWPQDKYYVYASDRPSDEDLEFDSLDDLLDNWIIQGKPLREILPDIEIG
jgi:hypothetical protein